MLAAAYDISETKQLAQGFKQINLCNKKRLATSKPSTLFPSNWSPQKCVEEIIDAIRNPKKISLYKKNQSFENISFEVTSNKNKKYVICFQSNNNINFFPIK